jgi:hypothetical protein
MSERIKTYEAFWPFYLGEHSLPLTRAVHFVGTTIAALLLVTAIVTLTWQPLIGALVSAYSCAWISHFFIEKNRPATFTYPAWSFVSDWRMWALMAVRRLDPELKRFNITPKSPATAATVKG